MEPAGTISVQDNVHLPQPPPQHAPYEGEMSQLLATLDESQRMAVCADLSSPLLILAGAGGGKTLTMASRIACMLLRGVAPEHLLGLCFSRQAAEALRDRVATVLPSSIAAVARRLKLKTFHAFELECLRRHGFIDLSTEVYDARRQRELAAAVVETHAVHHKSVEAVVGLIEYVNRAKTKKELSPGKDFNPSNQAAYLFSFYETMLHEQHHAVDFGDLEQMFLKALRPLNPQEEGMRAEHHHDNNVCAALSSRPPSPVAVQLRTQYTHIVVDEFQDLNEVQLECLALLAGDACRVTCVGDPNQCIYTWRGAATNTFERWRSRFPTTALVKLEKNYRSSAEIVKAVNDMVQVSQQSFKGHCGHNIILIRCPQAWEQFSILAHVVEVVLRERDRALAYGDMAILCRTRRTVRDVVAVLTREKIPARELHSRTPASISLIRAVLAYLRLCVHPHSNLDVECVLREAPYHFSSAAATKFIFALQAECLQRRRELDTARLQREESHVAYSYYTILRELVHNGFTHVHERLRTTKPQQKLLRILIEVTTAAHDALGRMYCDVEAVVRDVVMRAGFDEGSAVSVKISRCVSRGVKRQRMASLVRSATTIAWGEAAETEEEEDGDSTSGVSILQLLVEACHAVQTQIIAEKSTTATTTIIYNNNKNNNSPNDHNDAEMKVSSTAVRDDTYTQLQRVIDEFLALLPTDDYGPLKHSTGGESRVTAITVTTVHQAKGKEWPAVLLPCCYEGEFPIDMRSLEEKRVFYVAMSRAMRHLVLITAERGTTTTASGQEHSGYNNNNNNNNNSVSKEQPLKLTPYLRPILPLLETITLSCHQLQHSRGEIEERGGK